MAFLNVKTQSIRWLIAEITIVVVGILIAFQIDQWREDRNDRALEKVLLQNMVNDIDNELTNFQNYKEYTTTSTEASIALIDYLERSENENRDSQIIKELWLKITDEWRWRKTSPAYTGWRDTGRPDLVSDDALRARLFVVHEQWLTYLEEQSLRYQIASRQFIESSYEDFSFSFSSDDESNIYVKTTSVIPPVSEIPRNTEFMINLKRLSVEHASTQWNVNRTIGSLEELKLEINSHLESLY